MLLLIIGLSLYVSFVITLLDQQVSDPPAAVVVALLIQSVSASLTFALGITRTVFERT